MNIRFAREEDLEGINELRRQVHELHAAGKPEVFKPGFPPELRDHVRTVFRDPTQKILLCEEAGKPVGFAVLHSIHKPETPFMVEREFLDIDEFGVDAAHRRQGIATAMIRFLTAWAKEADFDRVELNMWEFNQEALAFYEQAGFQTYRRYLELSL